MYSQKTLNQDKMAEVRFVQKHINDIIPNSIEIIQPNFRAKFNTELSKIANEAIKEIMR